MGPSMSSFREQIVAPFLEYAQYKPFNCLCSSESPSDVHTPDPFEMNRRIAESHGLYIGDQKNNPSDIEDAVRRAWMSPNVDVSVDVSVDIKPENPDVAHCSIKITPNQGQLRWSYNLSKMKLSCQVFDGDSWTDVELDDPKDNLAELHLDVEEDCDFVNVYSGPIDASRDLPEPIAQVHVDKGNSSSEQDPRLSIEVMDRHQVAKHYGWRETVTPDCYGKDPEVGHRACDICEFHKFCSRKYFHDTGMWDINEL